MAGAIAMPRNQKKIGGIDAWEVRSALDTLSTSASIRKDKKMMRAVGIEARNQIRTLSKSAKK